LLDRSARLGGDAGPQCRGEPLPHGACCGTANGDRFAVVDGAWPALWSAVLLRSAHRPGLTQPPGHPLKPSARRRPCPHPVRWRCPFRPRWRLWCAEWPASWGVDRLQPLLAERGHRGGFRRGRTDAGRGDHGAKPASQCERLWLPELGEAVQAQEWPGAALAGLGPDPLASAGAASRLSSFSGPMGRLPSKRARRPRA